MLSLRFLLRLVTAPVAIVKALVSYYTVGTVYQKTNKEFRNSLYKNIHLSVECHLANNFTRDDVAIVLYNPVSNLIKKYKKSPMALGLNAFGESINERTFWINKAKDTSGAKKSALLFLHGGGYCLNVFDAQFVGIMGLFYSLSEEKRSGLSIAILDYSLTCHYKNYPTQINEAAKAYRDLVDLGYNDIILIGDSCGANLAAAMARFVAYPNEAKAHFSKFTDFEWDFSPMPQPSNMILISPWMEPYTDAVLDPNFDYTGDLGAKNTIMGEWYIEGHSVEDVCRFVKFTENDYATQWADVDSVNGKGRCLYLYGEREILKSGIEKFIVDITEKGQGKLEVVVEDGGIHDGLFYVESLDFLSNAGAKEAVKGNFEGKFGYTVVSKFLEEVI